MKKTRLFGGTECLVGTLILLGCGLFAGNGYGDDSGTSTAQLPKNNPSGTTPVTRDNPCGEEEEEINSATVNLKISRLSPLSTGGTPKLQWHILKPSPDALSPASLRLKLVPETLTGYWGTWEGGIPKNVYFEGENGAVHWFYFSEGAMTAKAKGRSEVDAQVLRMVDGNGDLTATDPVYYELLDGSGKRKRYNADIESEHFGELVEVVTEKGSLISPQQMGYHKILGTEGELRQIKGPGVLIDISMTAGNGLMVSYYSQGEFVDTPGPDGLYPLANGAQAYEIHHFEQPDQNNPNFIRRTKTTEYGLRVAEFTYHPDSGEWSLMVSENGTPAVRRHNKKAWNANQTVLSVSEWQTREGNAEKYAEVLEKWKELGGEMKLIETIEDPNALALTTKYTYHEDGNQPHKFSRRKSISRPDGTWTGMNYDTEGRLLFELHPWLDAPATVPSDLTANLANGDATLYDYTPHVAEDVPTFNDHRPRTVTRQILGQVVSKMFYVYGTDAGTGARYDIVEQAKTPTAGYGAVGNLRTRTEYFGPSEPTWKQGRVKKRSTPDGQVTTYDYQRGTWDPQSGEFDDTATNPKEFQTLVTRGTVASPLGVAYETTRTITIQNELGHVIRTETRVYVGSETYDLVSWENREYDVYGQLTQVVNSKGETSNYVKRASCCGADEVTNAQGVTTKTEHDGLDRVKARIKVHPTDSDKDLITEYTLDPAGRVLMEITRDRADTLSLISTYSYDGAGRRVASTPHTGGSSSTIYDDANRITTQVNPDGSTVITTRYLDGRTKSVTGTGTTHQYFEYGVNTDGSQWTKVYTGPALANSPMWSKSTTNMLGQSVKQEQPGYNGSLLVSTMTYNAKGQMVESTPAAGAATRYEYNDLGEQIASYVDVNDNDQLDLAGPDRIQESDTSYESDGSDYWMVNRSYVYDDGESTPILVSTSKQRLTGLGGTVAGKGTLVSESVSIDIHGNQTWSRRYLDRANQTALAEQDSSLTTADPDSRSININGLTTQTDNREPETGDWLSTTYDYDALERQVGTTDPRTGRSFVTYVTGKNLIAKQTDAAGNETLFTYYPDTARRATVTDPEGNTTHTAYTADGQTAATWGAAYPVVYEYDAYDRMVKLHTLRDPNTVFNPTVNDAGVLDLSSISQLLSTVTDVTTWTYEESTGLLTAKTYDDGNGPLYTYTLDGRLATRTWARGIVTTYGYDTETLELTSTSYSDGTPAIANTYDRLGRLEQTTDAFGTRDYAFNADLQPDTEGWSGLVTNTLTNRYDNAGRPDGVELATGYQTDYGYSATTGHFDTLTYTNSVNNVSHTADYAYVPDSQMIAGYTLGDLEREVVYEDHRNLPSTISNLLSSTNTILSAFDYTNDDAGRRTNRDDSGTAFPSTQANVFGYNARSEVTSAAMRNGTSTYNFDQIGNRTQISVPDEPSPVDYTANALNQYTLIDGATASSPSYDADGNMTHDGDSWWFAWNGENRLVEARDYDPTPVDGSIRLAFTYDAMGRRVRKTKEVYDLNSTTWSLTSDLRFFYDGWNLLYELDVVTAGPTRRYVWGLDLSQSMQGAGGVGGLLFTTITDNQQQTTTHGVTTDANGNISEYIDLSDGSITAHLEYDAFGRTIASTGTAPAPFGFSTKYQDDETGWYYYGFRYYDPETGRWPNRDPIQERGGLNLYGFVGNDGVNKTDFLGFVQTDRMWLEPGGYADANVTVEYDCNNAPSVVDAWANAFYTPMLWVEVEGVRIQNLSTKDSGCKSFNGTTYCYIERTYKFKGHARYRMGYGFNIGSVSGGGYTNWRPFSKIFEVTVWCPCPDK